MIRKVLYVLGFLLVAGFVVIQFFQPERNPQEPVGESDIIVFLGITGEVADILQTSCYDCHSNRTRYPWYSRIAPVSWYLDHHISEGREELNFSKFGSLRKSAQVGALSHISEEVDAGSMPLKSYLVIHRDAHLDEGKKALLVEWANAQMEEMLKK
jgi:hypothetical protein